LEFPLREGDISNAQRSLQEGRIAANDLVIGMHPGCSTLKNHERRRWDPANFAAVARRLIERHQARVLIFGGPEEEALKDTVFDLTGSAAAVRVRTDSLAHTAAVMKRCACFVTNDSSLMHVASAIGLNVVAVMGPTSPQYVHPWSTPHHIVRLGLDCSPCFVYHPRPLTCTRRDVQFKCIREITVDSVYDAVRSFLPSDGSAA
jgi:ADP-heptose:LPS heptosyltransferase